MAPIVHIVLGLPWSPNLSLPYLQFFWFNDIPVQLHHKTKLVSHLHYRDKHGEEIPNNWLLNWSLSKFKCNFCPMIFMEEQIKWICIYHNLYCNSQNHAYNASFFIRVTTIWFFFSREHDASPFFGFNYN